MHCVAVVDIGKTNAKLAIVDVNSRQEIAVVAEPNVVIDAPPYPHFDTDKLWEFLLTSLNDFSTRFNITAISVTTHGACVVLLDEHGQLATPVLDYEHAGPDQTADSYGSIRPSFDITGSPLLPVGLNAGAQLHWLFQQDPKLLDRVKTVVMYPQYWSYRFSGVLSNELTSLGCHTDLWNPVNGAFSDLVDTLNIREKMAEVKLPSTQLGTVLPAVAKKTGLGLDTAIYCGIHDSNASLYTHLINIDPPFSVVSTGTWVVCMSPGSKLKTLDENRDSLLNVSAYGEPTPSSRFMGGREYDTLLQTYSAKKTDEVMPNLADSNAYILPSVEPLSGPYQNCQYQWTVDPQSLTPEERYNVISFYLGMMTDTCLSLCQADGQIIIEGPFTKNQPYCAMLRAATNRTIFCSDSSSTGTSIGAAMLVLESSDTDLAKNYRELPTIRSLQRLKSYSHRWRQKTQAHISRS